MAKGGFRGGMGGGNMMKQAQKMQEEFMKMQQELESKEFTSTVGGGAVKATMIGTRALKSIEIDPSAVDPDDVEMLQDMIVAAVNFELDAEWALCVCTARRWRYTRVCLCFYPKRSLSRAGSLCRFRLCP